MSVYLSLRGKTSLGVHLYLAKGPHHPLISSLSFGDPEAFDQTFWRLVVQSEVLIPIPEHYSPTFYSFKEQYAQMRSFEENPGAHRKLLSHPLSFVKAHLVDFGTDTNHWICDKIPFSLYKGLRYKRCVKLTHLVLYRGSPCGFVVMTDLLKNARQSWKFLTDLIACQEDHPVQIPLEGFRIFLGIIMDRVPDYMLGVCMLENLIETMKWTLKEVNHFDLVRNNVSLSQFEINGLLEKILSKSTDSEFRKLFFKALGDSQSAKILENLIDQLDESEAPLYEDLIVQKGYLLGRRSLGGIHPLPETFMKILAKEGYLDLLDLDSQFYLSLDYSRANFVYKEILKRDCGGLSDRYYKENIPLTVNQHHLFMIERFLPKALGISLSIIFSKVCDEKVLLYLNRDLPNYPKEMDRYFLWVLTQERGPKVKQRALELLGEATREEEQKFEELYRTRFDCLEVEEYVLKPVLKRKLENLEDLPDPKRVRLI